MRFRGIVSGRRELPFLIFLSFLATFIVARTFVYLVTYGKIPNIFLEIRGVHIHHLNYGIFLLTYVGFYQLVFAKNEGKPYKTALTYGVGLGLTYDEFGMWLNLQDDYWVRQSYDAFMVISLTFLNIIFFADFWASIKAKVTKPLAKLTRFFTKIVCSYIYQREMIAKEMAADESSGEIESAHVQESSTDRVKAPR